MNADALFTPNLPLIERLVAAVCRRHGFPPDEAEEFSSWAKVRLLENDCAILRKFQGKSMLSTYLTTVVANLFRDYRIHRWGKWRPSAEARSLGFLAVQIETLVARDGRSIPEAIAHLRTNLRVELAASELEELAARLPSRVRRKFESDEALVDLPSPESTETRLGDSERRDTERRAEAALARALGSLAAVDRLVLKLRFADGMAIVDIAAMLGEPPRPLYTRLERSLATLRRALEGEGLEAAAVSDLVGWRGLDFKVDYGLLQEGAGMGPSHLLERLP